MTRSNILTILASNAATLRRDFGVTHLSLFGSYVRDEARADSDVDILVEFDPDRRIGMFAFARLGIELKRLLGKEVDLVTRAAIRPSMRDQIQREAVNAA